MRFDIHEKIRRITQLSRNGVLWSDDFERLIHEALEAELPFCVLGNVTLFRPDKFEAGENSSYAMAYEIDNLFHYRQAAVDYIVIVEAKNQPVRLRAGKWGLEYRDKETGRIKDSDGRKQLKKHVKAIQRYIGPLDPTFELKVRALLVSSDPRTPKIFPTQDESEWFGMCSYQDLPGWIQSIKVAQGKPAPEFMRVSQSEFLAKLRLGVPAPSLGHPELRHAVNYINRCRREIDEEFFRNFRPSQSRWAISGAAGSGKSVLLAYTAAVLASGREITAFGANFRLTSHEKRSAELGLPGLNARNICVLAMKSKQLCVLERQYGECVQRFNELNEKCRNLDFLRPRFRVWSDSAGVPQDCNVLLLDEAHDLSEKGQALIRQWHDGSKANYLVLGCDRHQKTRLIGSDARILDGISFKGLSVRLCRNYRNPFPIYAASLGLMFRWFASAGPKVIPTNAQLGDWLGFDVETICSGNGTVLKMRNDAHPGNSWSHSVGAFDSCNAAHEHLMQQNLSRTEVLWARFSAEEADFDYEQLSKFTYHNFFAAESADLVDKYVKGQEFPIVVIEGFPEEMDDFGTWNTDHKSMDPAECQMWNIRRQLYLCASRATGFLYFICNRPRTERIQRISAELAELLRNLSVPVEPKAVSGKQWRLIVKPTAHTRDLVDYDLYSSAPAGPTASKRTNQYRGVQNGEAEIGTSIQRNSGATSAPSARPRKDSFNIKKELTVGSLASILSMKGFQVIRALDGIQSLTGINDIVSPENACRVAKQQGVTLNFSAQAIAKTGTPTSKKLTAVAP